MEKRPYYIAYAGWYGHISDDNTWELDSFTYGAWHPCGHDAHYAIRLMNTYQQKNYDFCGVLTTFGS